MTDFKWRHFQGDVILWAVRWYCRYPISYRDLEEMLAERGISVDHTRNASAAAAINTAAFGPMEGRVTWEKIEKMKAGKGE